MPCHLFSLSLLGCLPPLIGLAVFAVGITFGANSGFALNPARDFSPRIFEAIIFGELPFTRFVNNVLFVFLTELNVLSFVPNHQRCVNSTGRQTSDDQ